MKIIVNNGSMIMKVFEPKRNWTDADLKGTGSVENSQLDKTTGNVYTSSQIHTIVSPLIPLSGATSIVCKGMDNKYVSRISFFDSVVSGLTAVYKDVSSNSNTGANTDYTIDSTVINAAIAAGADTFRIGLYPDNNNASVNVLTT